MKHQVTLTVTSFLSILFMTFHLTQDTLHARIGNPEAGGSTLVAVLAIRARAGIQQQTLSKIFRRQTREGRQPRRTEFIR